MIYIRKSVLLHFIQSLPFKQTSIIKFMKILFIPLKDISYEITTANIKE